MSIEVKTLIEQLPTFVVPIDIRTIVACDDADYAERRQSLLNRTYALQAEINAEVERLTADSIEYLDNSHEVLVVRCKASRNKFDELMSQQAYFEACQRQLSSVVTDATFALNLKRKNTLTPTYSTKQDYAQWQSELDALVEAEKTALKNLYNHQNLMTFWTADCRKAKAEHDALAVEELELRNRLNRLRKALSPQPSEVA